MPHARDRDQAVENKTSKLINRNSVGILIAALALGYGVSSANAQNNLGQSPVALVGGELEYNPYTNYCTRPTCNSSNEPRTNRLRGYSYAGYRGGGVALPDVAVGTRLQSGTGRGQLRPNDSGAAQANHDIIQRALNNVSGRADRPRAVLLPQGRFFITPGLEMTRSGVVLRGAGQGEDGTVLVAVVDEVSAGHIIEVGQDNDRRDIANSRLSSSASLSGGTVSNIGDGDWVMISNLLTNNLNALGMSYTNSGNTGIDFTIRRGSPTGEIVGHLRSQPSGTSGSGSLFAYTDAELSGQHDIYIVFESDSGNRLSVSDINIRVPFREDGARRQITQPVVVTGESNIRVQNPGSFSVGDRVMVTKTVNQDWIDYIEVNDSLRPPPRGDDRLWRETTYDMTHERTVVGVSGGEIELDAPMMDPIYRDFGGGFVVKIEPIERISNVGIEDIRIENDLAPSGSSSHPENQTPSGVAIRFVENSWIDGLTCRTMVRNCVGLRQFSRYVTVQNSATFDWASRITGGRRYAYEGYTDAASSLFQRLWVEGGRHDYVTGAQATGPLVFLDALSVNTQNDIGPHHRYSTSLLFDNIRGGELSAEQRGTSGTGHGYTGAQVTYWNSDSLRANVNSRRTATTDLHVESPPSARNFAVGGQAARTRIFGGGSAFGVNTGGASLVTPRSLYLAELEDRRNAAAVRAVTIPAQRSGQIYDLLGSWRGEGPLETSSTVVRPSDDTYVRFGVHGSTNFANSGGRPNRELQVKKSPSTTTDFNRWTFIEFDLSGIDRSAFRTVTLEMRVEDIGRLSPGVTPVTVRAHDSLNFSEDRLTVRNLPTRQNRETMGALMVRDTGIVRLNVSEIMRTNTSDLIYFELRDDARTNNLITFSSSEGGFSPRLVFE